uniref:Carbamoyl phosphate synthase arginine-specific large chain n=1 Tax=Panagrellus redivivus TaxID=6233 RepID=A0A7E5A1Q8_PANRE
MSSSASWEAMSGTLILSDGTTFPGRVYGAAKSVVGEVVFQTGMVGYVEALSDPSYHKQFLTLTFPLIGNYGVPNANIIDKNDDIPKYVESAKVWPSALIVDALCPEGEASHGDAIKSLSTWLSEQGVPILAGVDTRALTKHIREKGSMSAKLVIEADDPETIEFVDINTENLVQQVSRTDPKTYGKGPLKVLAVDCGLKYNQLRCLIKLGCTVTVVPFDHPIEKETDYDGLFISNGPGDPQMCTELINRLSEILARPNAKPVFGICLGHQLLSKAIGAATYKLRYGNRGHNQPCTHTDTGRCFITSQNHGYATDAKTLPEDWIELFINENDKTNEGICHKTRPFFSVQFHPEQCAGPTDMNLLIDIFVQAMQKAKDNTTFILRDMITSKLQYTCTYSIPEQRKILILGSGGLTIGQAGEFDYSGAQAIKALKERGIRTVLINPNVATVQTSKGFADQTYFLPVTKEYVTDVIKKERPSGILCTFGGQTALNVAVDLYKEGIFAQYHVEVLGTPIDTIIITEDRELFNAEIEKIGAKVAPSKAATTIEEAIAAGDEIGYPVLVRAAFALGGLGSGFANNKTELHSLAQKAFAHSNQVLIDKSLWGYKELEYEVVRDAYDNCITVCNMENVDPVGIHTGESVVVAPSQTLNDREYNELRDTALKVIRHLGVIGECNIQYALHPTRLEYYIIEVNARLSRSSALASKATGYPLAYIAAKLALGDRLSELRNTVTGETTACFEPSLDYCVVKIPRWDLSKFARVSTKIGSSMKSVGEVMGIGRNFEEAFQKALRMVNDHYEGFTPFIFGRETTKEDFTDPTDKRMVAIARALFFGEFTLEEIHTYTCIDRWFLYRMKNVIDLYKRIQKVTGDVPRDLLLEAKKCGFSDAQIARTIKNASDVIRNLRKRYGITPVVKQIDTVAAEWPATTNYLYLTYNGTHHDVEATGKNSVAVLGSGVYRIGSSVEFDACCVGCVRELKKLEYSTIMINCNPETVSTDYDICDKLYFEEISLESVGAIYEFERPLGVILGFGGQAPNNIAMTLARSKFDVPIKIFGTSPEKIDNAEDRFKFSRSLDEFKGAIKQPRWKQASNVEEAEAFCQEVGYPCLIRPSYVLSGAAMNVAHNHEDLKNFLSQAVVVAKDHPVVVSKFIGGAKEIDVDAVAQKGRVIVMAVCEHIENAGIHSGDATLVCPPFDLTERTIEQVRLITARIAEKLEVNGPFNMQLIAKDDELYVIECNLRASRSFPFVSKTLDFDFIAAATCVMMDKLVKAPDDVMFGRRVAKSDRRFGVKVPQFSFSRLAGADVIQGVEMVSTGEVACYGKDHLEAYLKGLLATGFVLPKKNVFLSFGGVTTKSEMLESVEILSALGFDLFASKGTADYYNSKNINVKTVDWPFEEGGNDVGTSSSAKTAANAKTIGDYVENKDIDLVINLPIKGSGAYRVSAYRTQGYKTRRMAVDNGIPLLTDIKCTKLFVKALEQTRQQGHTYPAFNSQFDAVSSQQLKRLPGLIDIHVHMREPGGEHKETWTTGSRAAVAGGVTVILAMPNTNPPLVDEAAFDLVESKAAAQSIADYALFIGATPNNVSVAKGLANKVAGMKMYLNETFATLQLPNTADWLAHFQSFPRNRPIVCHAEKQTLAAVLAIAQLADRHVHICHISTAEEIGLIRQAKDKGWKVTCEVCPHHLIFADADLEAGWKEVRPRLASKKDAEALWDNLDYIDCFATDHAPHTPEEKQKGTPGYPGIEYMLPLLLTKVKEKKLSMKQLIDRLYNNPRRIFNLPEQPDTYIEIALDEEWTIPEDGGQSKAGWTPFAGMKVTGRVRNVIIRGEEVYIDGNFIAEPGFGQNIRLAKSAEAKLLHDEPSFDSDVAATDKQRTPSGDSGTVAHDFSPSRALARSASPERNPLYRKHILNVESFTKDMVYLVLGEAGNLRRLSAERRDAICTKLAGYAMGSIFYEPSSRTKCSFGFAMKRLGGAVEELDVATSSVKKGESFEDTIATIDGYADVIVLRHPEAGAAERAAAVARNPIINAGDGTGQHPTQALLDLYTIRAELSTINNLTIALVGDLKNGRTVHSLAKILCLYRGITFHYVSPTEDLGMPQEIIDYVNEHSDGNFVQKKFTNMEEGIRGVDVIYMTRIQKERFASAADYERVKGKFVLTPRLLNEARDELHEDYNVLGRTVNLPIVMHPMPRVDEISPEVDADMRAAYFRQSENGVYVRMALLKMVLGVE